MENSKPINQISIKYILIFLMTLDHIAHFLSSSNPLYLPFRFISRLTAPIMAYFVAEGYRYTSNIKKYILRLFVFALISHIPFMLLAYNSYHTFILVDGNVASNICLYLSRINKTLVINGTSVIYTLLLGLVSIILWDKAKLSIWLKLIIQLFIFWLALFGDWKFVNVLYCLLFYFLREDKKKMWMAYILVSCIYIFNIFYNVNPFNITLNFEFFLYRAGTLLVIPFVEYLYNEKRGKKTFVNKWFFYIYYPTHMLLMYLLFN